MLFYIFVHSNRVTCSILLYYLLLKQLFFAVCFLLVFDPESNYKRSRGKQVGIRRLGIGTLVVVLYSDAAYYASGKKTIRL